MSAYAVAIIQDLKDAEMFTAYRAKAGEALARHGGRVSHLAESPERLEGDLDQPRALVLLEFPSAEAAKAWHGDPDLAKTHALRTGGADVSIFVAGEPV